MASPERIMRNPSPGLPLDDALFEILLRLPARDICRARAVCRSWRAMASDPLFIGAHASRHPGPYIAATAVDDPRAVDIRRIHIGFRDFRVQRARLDAVCFVEGLNPLYVTVMNPATGSAAASCASVKSISDKYEYLLERCYVTMDSCAFGKVPSTYGRVQGIPIPSFWTFLYPTAAMRGSIVPFNLETEEWMGILNGPKPVTDLYREDIMGVIFSNLQAEQLLTITDLNGSLVTVHAVCGSRMDLWFLSDFEKGLWMKKYSIDFPYNRLSTYPLLLLDDERIVFLVQATNEL
uniref:F-box domain-containing protein n=1 Tax=Leersia perrieri TaxID=77586 RepID=A0A0D9WWJ8_9ORYZ